MSARRRRRRISIITPILFLIVIALLVFIGLILYKQHKKSKEPIFEYVSIAEEASARALVWLNDIDDIELSFEDVKECMGEFNLEVKYTPTETKGIYTVELMPDCYEYCESQAKIGLEKSYRLAVINRLQKVGYEGPCTDETVEKLMKTTFGITVADYLEQCEISLLPSFEELNAKYSGEVER